MKFVVNSYLVKSLTVKLPDKEDFPIMLTYLLGQGLTYPGLAFAVISIV